MDTLSLLVPLIFTLSAFVAAMLIVVAVHELGHYLVARWTGIHAEVFSIGFGRKIIERADRHGTIWRIAWLPIGGYVKFHNPQSGESEDGKGSYSDASLLARTLTIAAGPAANFVFAILIFGAVTMVSGVPVKEAVVGSAIPGPVEADFRRGDRILEVDGVSVETLADIRSVPGLVEPGRTSVWTIDRDGEILSLEGPFPNIPLIRHVRPASPADSAGIRRGDTILAVNGDEILDFLSLRSAIMGSDGRPVAMTVWRDGAVRDIVVTPVLTDMPSDGGSFTSNWMVGFSIDLPFEEMRTTPDPLTAIAMGAARSADIVAVSVSAISNIVRGAISHCNIRGVITMAEVSGATANQGVQSFILFLAVLSVVIGFMNLLPIPVLDGGHLVFHAWEAISGRAPGHRMASVMMTIGVASLIALMTFGLINDLMCS